MKRKLKEMNRLPAATTDGRQVALFANAGSLRDVELAKKHGAEGIGLFRSEFLYMESSRFPTEQEQFEISPLHPAGILKLIYHDVMDIRSYLFEYKRGVTVFHQLMEQGIRI